MLDTAPSEPQGDSLHVRFAYELVAEAGGHSQRVMRELVGGPRRYADLQRLGWGRSENELADALRRLEGKGLVERRTSFREVAVTHTFELTTLGSRAEVVMRALRPANEVAPPGPRRQRSELGRGRGF